MPPSLAQLRRRHPTHQESADYWDLLNALLQGGSKLTPAIKQQLLCNPDNRPDDIIKQRVKVARYFNKIGPIASRFLSQLFAAPISYEGSKDSFWTDTFFPAGAMLPAEDDDGRASFQAFQRAAVLQGLGQGKAIAQIDTAIASDTSRTKADQRRLKEDEPYVLLVPRGDLWDWQSDRNGFNFAKLHRFSWSRDTWDSDPVALHDFTIYQRKPDGSIVLSRYTVQHVDKGGNQFDQGVQNYNIANLSDTDVQITRVGKLEEAKVFHKGTKYKFPIVTMPFPSALWLADQLHDPQVSHYNQTASLEWGLVSSNYSMLTVTADDLDDFTERNKKVGEGYFLHLDPENKDAVAWTERNGNSFSTSMQYRDKVDADIDKTVQQIALAAADAVTSTSGEAIRQARKPEEILLMIYGAMVRDFSKSCLDVAAIAHDEDVSWKVDGLDDFDETDLTSEASEYEVVTQAGIPSPTFTKEFQKSFVREVAKQKQFEPKLLKKMLAEIEQAPSQDAPSEDDSDNSDGSQPPSSNGSQSNGTDAILQQLGLN